MLEAYLGSCVAVSLFDRHALVGGLVHIVLPQATREKETLFPARYASTGIPVLISEMLKLGASKENIVAEIAGGALILTDQKLSVDMNIGRRNSAMAEEILIKQGIPLISKATGGRLGRVVTLEPGTGKTDIRYMGKKLSRIGLPLRLKKIELEDFKTRIESLKPVPDRARRVISMLEFSEYGPVDLENYVLKDQAICANVLKMCNSAKHGFRHKIKSISRAAALLGLNTLKDIVLAASKYKLYDKAPPGYSTQEGDLSRHSICCAMVAELIAHQKRLRDPRVFYTAGLLHDIGKSILDQYAFENFNLVMDRVVNEAKTFLEAENEILGYDHTQIGGIAAMEWGLPQVLVEAISFHHMPEQAAENSEVVSVVHVADMICSMFGAGSSPSVGAAQPQQHALSTIDLRAEDVDNIIEQLPHVMKRIEGLGN
ncbi:MAG: HDOD domain-containing protein [Desulfobacterales bacterium]|nr:HDOD domain-containing protein [Desulfobacterales bacterium]